MLDVKFESTSFLGRTLVVDKASERVDVEVHWVGGSVEAYTLSRSVKRYDFQSDYPTGCGPGAPTG
jgi:hypothetical protein